MKKEDEEETKKGEQKKDTKTLKINTLSDDIKYENIKPIDSKDTENTKIFKTEDVTTTAHMIVESLAQFACALVLYLLGAFRRQPLLFGLLAAVQLLHAPLAPFLGLGPPLRLLAPQRVGTRQTPRVVVLRRHAALRADGQMAERIIGVQTGVETTIETFFSINMVKVS